jgi:hypothetical protein
MNGEPIRKAFRDFHVKPFGKETIQFSYRLAHCRTNRSGRKFAELSDKGDIIDGWMRRLGKNK